MGEGVLRRARDHLDAARAARRRVDLDEHRAEIEQLEAELEGAPAGHEREVLSWAAAAERMRDVGYLTTDEDELLATEREAQTLLDRAGRDHPDVSARLNLARAQVAARLHRRGWEDEATTRYTTAARRFIDSGELEEAGVVLADLAWTVQLTAGRLRAAHASMTEALSFTTEPSLRAAFLSQRARLHIRLGDLAAAQADVDAAWPIAQRGDDRAIAYVAWAAAVIGSLKGQRSVVRSWIGHADRHRGAWADGNVTGFWYEAEAIDALARVGARGEARQRLESLVAHAQHEPTAVAIAQISVEARSGNPAVAFTAWETLRVRPDLEPWDAAWMRLLLAYAAERQGDRSGQVAAEAFEMCAALEEPGVLLTMEPVIAQEFLPRAAEAGSAVAARLLRARPDWRIRLLGGFEVADEEGRPVPLTGRSRRLVMDLAVHGEPVSRDAVGRRLWPERHDERDRRQRLRRVLHRTRSKLPEAIETLAGDRLGLSDVVDVDLGRVLRAVREARSVRDPVRRVAAVRDALEHFRGDLLPGEVIDDDWLEPFRRSLARDWTWLHTVMAEHEHAHGRDESAVHHARAVLAAEPTNEAAATVAVDSLRRSGRRGEAQRVLDATERALAAMGLNAGPLLRGASVRLRGVRPEDGD